MPAAPTRKPRAQAQALANMAFRGPTRSTHVPSIAAERPSMTIAIEKTRPTAVRLLSKWATIDAL